MIFNFFWTVYAFIILTYTLVIIGLLIGQVNEQLIFDFEGLDLSCDDAFFQNEQSAAGKNS